MKVGTAMNFEVYKVVCTNCVYNCNGELKQIQKTRQHTVTTWKCVNFKPIYVEQRESIRKHFCNRLSKEKYNCMYMNKTKLF